jgi:hypothetical protein
MYELFLRNCQTGFKWQSSGEKSGAMSALRDKARLANTDYAIKDEQGNVVWAFEHPRPEEEITE